MALLLGPCGPCMSGPDMSLPTRLPPQWVTLVMACSEILQAGLPPSTVHAKRGRSQHCARMADGQTLMPAVARSHKRWQDLENKLLAQQSQMGPATGSAAMLPQQHTCHGQVQQPLPARTPTCKRAPRQHSVLQSKRPRHSLTGPRGSQLEAQEGAEATPKPQDQDGNGRPDDIRSRAVSRGEG